MIKAFTGYAKDMEDAVGFALSKYGEWKKSPEAKPYKEIEISTTSSSLLRPKFEDWEHTYTLTVHLESVGP